MVSFQSAEIIADCLDSLVASRGVRVKIVVLDNASADQSVECIRAWAAARAAELSFEEGEVGAIGSAQADLTLLRSPINGGFAYGTNRCLEILLSNQELDLFWLVNPDARAEPDCALHYARHGSDGNFSLMGGRTLFAEDPQTVQTDGGWVSLTTGRCRSINWGQPADRASMPAPDTIDFITGANCVASRRFIEQSGLMREDYFIYYEEVDWAMRRGALDLRIVPQATALHMGGTTIGTGSVGRRPSPFANYFNYRNRMRFLRRFSPRSVPLGLAFGLLKAMQLLLLGAPAEGQAVLTGILGLSPPERVRACLSPAAQQLAFAKEAA